MTGTGRAIVSTPAMAHKDPTIFPHTPTGLEEMGDKTKKLWQVWKGGLVFNYKNDKYKNTEWQAGIQESIMQT
jgi:hypothetical protein